MSIPSIVGEHSLLEQKAMLSPHAFGEHLREMGPIFHWPRGGMYVITDYHLARKALRHPQLSCDRSEFFISRMPEMDLSLITHFFSTVHKMMIMSDQDLHTRRRAAAAKAFHQDLIAAYGRVAESISENLVGNLKGDSFDFFTEVASILPSAVLAELFSIRLEDRPDFFAWATNMTKFFGGASRYQNADGIEVNQSALGITGYLEESLDAGKSPFLSHMASFATELGLDRSEIISQAVMMIVAGQVTTTDQLCNNLYTLLSHPELFQSLREKPDTAAMVIEECNRWDPGVSFLFRVVNGDCKLDEYELADKAVIFMSTHAVNRDPVVFSSPGELQPLRHPNPHMAYGQGSHYCLGAPLARLQMQSLFRIIADRFPDATILDSERDHYSLAFSGFKRLVVASPRSYS